jgi:hypothetical protein
MPTSLPALTAETAPGVRVCNTCASAPAAQPAKILTPQTCTDCDRGPIGWFRTDYLMWWARRGSTPPLVSTGPLTDPFPGALGQPGTTVLFGNNGLNFGQFNGLRLETGFWTDRSQSLGFELGGFFTERRTSQFSLAGDANGQPFFGRPFIEAASGAPNLFFVSQNFPNPVLAAGITGRIDVSGGSRVWGWEANGVTNLNSSQSLRTDLLAGVRSVGLDENLAIGESISSVFPAGGNVFLAGLPIPPGASVHTADLFQTQNRFYGPQVGGRVSWNRGPLLVAATTKLAMGVTQELVELEGRSSLVANGAVTQVVPGSVYVVGSNAGRYFRDQFGVIPEFRLDLGYRVAEQLIARLGYTFLYWNQVARPGSQIDPVVSPTQVPSDFAYAPGTGPLRPTFRMHESDYWTMGLNLGVEYRY